MKKYIATLLLLTALQASAQTTEPNLKWGKPTGQELQMTEYAADKDADAVVLCHLTDVSYTVLDGKFKVFYRVNGRLKVLKPEGKRVADMAFTYTEDKDNNYQKDAVTVLKATTYNMEGGQLVKTKMDHASVNRERIDKSTMLLKFSVPQVKVGSVIEYEYRIESDFFYDIRDWNAQGDIPVAYTRYVLTIPESLKFNIESTGVNPMENKREDSNMSVNVGGSTTNMKTTVWTFVGRNLPALKGDDYVWCAENYGNRVTAELSDVYIPGFVHKKFTTTWDDIDKQLLDDSDFGGRLKKSSPLKEDIMAAGIPSIADKQERAAAVCQLLRSKVRWNGDYALWGNAASRILKEGTGTNADMNFLLISMLHDAGIESAPIVLRTRDKGTLPITHSSLKYLNTFVVGIQTSDSTMAFFDGSAEDGCLNVLPAKLLVDRARIVKKNATEKWVNLQAHAQGREVASIQAQLHADGRLEGQKTTRMTDEDAAALRRTWRLAKDSAEVINQMQERDGVEILSYQTEGLHDFSPQVTERLTFTKQCDTAGDIIYLNPLVFNPLRESPFTSAERQLPVEFPYRQSETLSIMITLPDGYVAEDIPQPIILKLDGATARVRCSSADGQLTVQYLLSVEKTFYAQAEYPDLKSFFDHLAEYNKSIITIKKKP